jgi:hypothetical protein
METHFEIILKISTLLQGWHTKDYIRSYGVESQFLSPNKDATSITFYSNQSYYEIFTLEYLCPLRLPLPHTEQEFISDINRCNIKLN